MTYRDPARNPSTLYDQWASQHCAGRSEGVGRRRRNPRLDFATVATSLTFDAHLAALEESDWRLAELAETTPLTSRVPTCPDWDVIALVAHQSMVHRWATANIVGTDPDAAPSDVELRRRDDLVEYYRDGLTALVGALRSAPADLEAITFLNDAPPPRQFWARRQTHETTIHMIDALAAHLARPPTAAEAGIGIGLAIDGIDELLCGFLTRGDSRLYDGEELVVCVAPDDAERSWTMRIAQQASAVPGGTNDADVAVVGAAAQIYLGLWNRGDELVVNGRNDFLERWRGAQRVRWTA